MSYQHWPITLYYVTMTELKMIKIEKNWFHIFISVLTIFSVSLQRCTCELLLETSKHSTRQVRRNLLENFRGLKRVIEFFNSDNFNIR